MKISKNKAQELYDKYNFNPNLIPFEYFRYALSVEAEHAKTVKRNINTIAKIVVDHLKESIFYYEELKKMEKRLEELNKQFPKQDLFL
jgi:hypothetical protein